MDPTLNPISPKASAGSENPSRLGKPPRETNDGFAAAYSSTRSSPEAEKGTVAPDDSDTEVAKPPQVAPGTGLGQSIEGTQEVASEAGEAVEFRLDRETAVAATRSPDTDADGGLSLPHTPRDATDSLKDSAVSSEDTLKHSATRAAIHLESDEGSLETKFSPTRLHSTGSPIDSQALLNPQADPSQTRSTSSETSVVGLPIASGFQGPEDLPEIAVDAQRSSHLQKTKAQRISFSGGASVNATARAYPAAGNGQHSASDLIPGSFQGPYETISARLLGSKVVIPAPLSGPNEEIPHSFLGLNKDLNATAAMKGAGTAYNSAATYLSVTPAAHGFAKQEAGTFQPGIVESEQAELSGTNQAESAPKRALTVLNQHTGPKTLNGSVPFDAPDAARAQPLSFAVPPGENGVSAPRIQDGYKANDLRPQGQIRSELNGTSGARPGAANEPRIPRPPMAQVHATSTEPLQSTETDRLGPSGAGVPPSETSEWTKGSEVAPRRPVLPDALDGSPQPHAARTPETTSTPQAALTRAEDVPAQHAMASTAKATIKLDNGPSAALPSAGTLQSNGVLDQKPLEQFRTIYVPSPRNTSANILPSGDESDPVVRQVRENDLKSGSNTTAPAIPVLAGPVAGSGASASSSPYDRTRDPGRSERSHRGRDEAGHIMHSGPRNTAITGTQANLHSPDLSTAQPIQAMAATAQGVAGQSFVDFARADVQGSELARVEADPRPTSAASTPHAPSYPTADARTAQAVAQQLAAQVGKSSSDGSVEISLKPEELGRVRMLLSTSDGVITVTVNADRSETLDLIRRNIETLQQEFRDLGYRDMNFAFSQNKGHAPQNGSATQSSDNEVPWDDGMPIQTRAPTNMNTNGAVDIRL